MHPKYAIAPCISTGGASRHTMPMLFEISSKALEKFVEEYETQERIMEAYHMPIYVNKNSFSEKGQLGLSFANEIIYPQSLVAEYMTDYVEQVPEINPSE